VGSPPGDDALVPMDAFYAMSNTHQVFTLPIARFDANLLPPDSRKIGSDSFKDAVALYFAAQYATKGLSAIVVVNTDEISVLALPPDAVALDFVLGMLQEGKIKEAVPFLERLSRDLPDSAEVLYNLGIAYSELKQFDEAIIRLKKAVQLDPTHAHAWTGIGVAYQRMGKREPALEAFERAVATNPEDGYSQRNLGAALLSQGRAYEALRHLEAARNALPHDPQATYGLAAAYEEVGGDENRSAADELYQVVIDRWPGSQIAELAREARTRFAQQSVKTAVGGGIRPDVVMYIRGALDTFAEVGAKRTQEIAFEVAMKGQEGLDINNPEQKYALKTLPGNFSGLHLVAIMYAGFKQLDPSLDGGIDFSAEYEAAKALGGHA
jgi:tetratricopeptide (TPR) repeat protein